MLGPFPSSWLALLARFATSVGIRPRYVTHRRRSLVVIDDRIPALFNSWAIVFRRRLGDYRWLRARDDRPGIDEDIIPCTPDIDLVRSSRRISRPSANWSTRALAAR